MSIRVVQHSANKHLIIAWLDAWHQMGWSEGNLFSLSVVVSWVAVQSDLSDWDERVVRMWPDLSNVENVKSVVGSIFLWHCLNKPVPAWEVTFCNFIIKVVCAPLRVLQTLCSSFSSSEILNALSSFVVILNIVNFALSIDPSVSVG